MMSDSMQQKIAADFAELKARLTRLEKAYNPADDNLHFDAVPRADAALFDALLKLAQEGLAKVRQHHTYFSHSKHQRLYDDGMFWYGLCLLASAAARRVAGDKAQHTISPAAVNALTELFVEVSEYSTVGGGCDMEKRNWEALGNILWAFYSDTLVTLARHKSQALGLTPVIQFVEGTIARVNEVRQREE
jgi:hypothetical protein